MMHHIERLSAILIFLILSGCSNQEFDCFNYCMDALYTTGLSAVVIDKDTQLPVVNASITINESENQICQPCSDFKTLNLKTDEKGWFILPFDLRRDYMINIKIEANSCETYVGDYRAFDLDDIEGYPVKTFELSCDY